MPADCEGCTRRVHADCVDELETQFKGEVVERKVGEQYFASLLIQGRRAHSSAACDSCCDAISDLLMRVRRATAERGAEFVGGA